MTFDLDSSGWWWLVNSVLLTRASCRKITHADDSVSAFPITLCPYDTSDFLSSSLFLGATYVPNSSCVFPALVLESTASLSSPGSFQGE